MSLRWANQCRWDGWVMWQAHGRRK